MVQLSSGATLLLRLFLPTVWTVFFGSFMVMGWFWEDSFIGPFSVSAYRWATTLFVAAGLLAIRLTLWRLHRVDADQEYLYISNYFRTYRYTLSSVQAISSYPAGLFTLARIVLPAKGKLGRVIWFLPAGRRLNAFLEDHPQWKDLEP